MLRQKDREERLKVASHPRPPETFVCLIQRSEQEVRSEGIAVTWRLSSPSVACGVGSSIGPIRTDQNQSSSVRGDVPDHRKLDGDSQDGQQRDDRPLKGSKVK